MLQICREKSNVCETGFNSKINVFYDFDIFEEYLKNGKTYGKKIDYLKFVS